MDILANISGLSFSLPDLYTEVTKYGWEIKKVKYDGRLDRFVATATNPSGEELSMWGPDERLAVANLLFNVVARAKTRMSKVSMWSHTFTDQLVEIAQAYSKASLYEPKAAVAFMELGRDSVRRAKALQEHLEITLSNNPEPYTSPEKMFDDIRKRRKLEVSRAGLDHPLWSAEQVVAYRVVHDVLGHAASGGGFDWEGENRAFAAHAAIIPVEAQKALFTESIGSTAYATYFKAYGPLKVALFPQFMDQAQEEENPHSGYRGVHPSQTHPPVVEPSVKPILGHLDPDARIERKTAQKLADAPWRGIERGQTGQLVPSAVSDPNEHWQSGVAPLPQNAYLDHGDPLESQAGMDNAQLIDTEWAYLERENPAQLAQMKLAVTNAFRVVLLSPRKDLRWNAVHYQDISHIPGEVDDPDTYWDALEKARQSWNVQRHGEQARFQHMPYYRQWKELEQLTYQKNPKKGWAWAQAEAKRRLRRWQTQEQKDVMREDADLPEENQRDMYKIDLEANKRLQQRLKLYLSEHQPELDPRVGALEAPPLEKKLRQPYQGPTEESMFDVPQTKVPDKSKYGAWMGDHLRSISQISRHVDEILEAALFDVHERDGTGHHFRSSVLNLGISGVGPKVCSFAWLLLQPMTSQLATIDTHMMDVLGHHFEKDMSPRDYFKYERELGAGRDAAGYGHVPLGAFQWMMWDHKRTGEGTHQDHSAMKVLDPTPHDMIDWKDKQSGLKGENWVAPDWWMATQPARDAVADDWDQTVGRNVPKNQIPYSAGAPMGVYTKVAASYLTPWFTHPDTGEEVVGQPGQTIMQHMQSIGLSLPQAWSIENAGKR